MVRMTGIEPARGYRQNLNLVRLPIPPHPQNKQIICLNIRFVNKNSNHQKMNGEVAECNKRAPDYYL